MGFAISILIVGVACVIWKKAGGRILVLSSPLLIMAAIAMISVFSPYKFPGGAKEREFRCMDKNGEYYQIIDRRLVKGKSQLDLKILASSEDTPEMVQGRLKSALSDAKCADDYSFGPPAMSVWIYAFLSEEEARGNSVHWIGLLRWPGIGLPDIQVKTERLAALQNKSEPKAGMPPRDVQQRIYRQIAAAEREVTRRINLELPLSIPGNVKKNAEISRSALETYHKQLAQEHKISVKTLREILGRGVREDWPAP